MGAAAITLASLRKRKADGKKFSMLTAYDATFAKAMAAGGVDALLVGDSLGMVVQGKASTIPVHLAQMVYHTAAVARANTPCFLVADMPFASAPTPQDALRGAARLMRAGAHAVKLERLERQSDFVEIIRHLRAQSVPVCAHFGLTPQSVHQDGGYRVQGREPADAARIASEVAAADAAGVDLLLLECVPAPLAARISKAARAPVIGIGAGADVDAQVLVMHDMLGLNFHAKRPRFVKDFLAESAGITEAFRNYHEAVMNGDFPTSEHSFSA